MAKFIELQEVNADPFDLYMRPPGAYLTPTGIALVMNGSSTVFNYSGWQSIVKDGSGGAQPSSGSGLATIDVHRLIDQVAALSKPPAPLS